MKPSSLIGLVLAVSIVGSTATLAQTVFINLSGATVYDSLGSPLADGDTVQLIASTSDLSFSSPTAGSFVSGDDVVLASFALDSSVIGTSGSFQKVLTINEADFLNLSAGDPLLLRWFDVAYSPSAAGPGASHFGEFRTDSTVDQSTSGWLLQSSGTIDLNFVTTANGGSQPESAGFAATAVPEPASGSLLLCIAGGTAAMCLRRRKRSISATDR